MTELAKFHAMTEASLEDWKIIDRECGHYAKALPDRIFEHLGLLQSEGGGFAVNRLEHSLQTATRAYDAGRDEEYVVCALLHDIGDILGCYSHADIAAAMLKPFVSEQYHWMVLNHTVFQGYYYNDYYGKDKNQRHKFLGNQYFDITEEFCRLYDQNSFDPTFKSMSLASFQPMLRRVFKEPKVGAPVLSSATSS